MAISRLNHAVCRVSAFCPGSANHRVSFLPAQRAIWYRVPKVATNSIQHLLDEHPAIETYRIAGKMNIPSFLCKQWTRFGFVRHPITRVHSAWKDKVLRSNFFDLPAALYQEVQDFDGFLEWLSTLDLQRAEPHVRLQCHLMPVSKMTFIGKIETLHEDIERLFRLWQLTPPTLKQANKTTQLDEPTAAQESLIRSLYAADFEAFYPRD